MILESLRAGVAFLPRAWARPWFVAMIAATAAAGFGFSLLASTRPWLPSVILLATLFYLPLAQGPLYTLALANAPPESNMSGGIARYARLVAVGLLTAIFLAIPGLLLSVIALGVAYGMAFAHPGFNPADAATWTANGQVLVGGGGVIALGFLTVLWLFSRVSLGPAVSVAERRVVMLSTWPLTRGFGWRIAVARLVLGAGALIVVLIVRRSVEGLVPSGGSAGIVPIVSDLLLMAIGLPVEVGVLSYFHVRRSPLPAAP